jgi:hypothetical protein
MLADCCDAVRAVWPCSVADACCGYRHLFNVIGPPAPSRCAEMRWVVERVRGGQRPATASSPSRVGSDPGKDRATVTCLTTQPHAHVTQHGPTVLLVQGRMSDARRER